MSVLMLSLAALSPMAPGQTQTLEYEQIVRCALVYSMITDEALDRNEDVWAEKNDAAAGQAANIAKGVGTTKNMAAVQIDADLGGAYAKYKDQYPNLGSKVIEAGRCDRALGLDTRRPPRG